MSRRFTEWGLAFLLAAALLFITSSHLTLFILSWCASLLCFFLAAIALPMQPAADALSEEYQLPTTAEPHREWRFHSSKEIITCSGCSKQVAGGWWSPWIADPVNMAYGEWFSKTDDHFCASCAQLREQAEQLGIEGVAVEFAAGNLVEDRRDEMLDYLLDSKDSD